MTKRTTFITFFSIILTLYGFLNYYIFSHGLDLVTEHTTTRILFTVIFWTIALAYLAGRFLEHWKISAVSTTLVWIGSFWLAAMIYLYFIVLTMDILKLFNYLLHIVPLTLYNNFASWFFSIATLGVIIALIIGYLNAKSLRIKRLNLTIHKKAGSRSRLTIAAASDIHLGTIIGRNRLGKIVEMINSMQADIVLLPGDIVDEDLGPVINNNLGEVLRSIRSRFGVFAITGNHEYIGGVEEACQYLIDHNITMLRDAAIKIDESFYIIGREDRSIRQFNGKSRMPLKELLAEVDTQLPLIMMDHQPGKLQDAVDHGIDLQISGHTHHAQLWPFHLITERIFEVSWGYKKKSNTHIYVSSGTGTWGPPVRLGNTPEIIHLELIFQPQS
ncbi:MAG: metallophosphoesterase [bacterium]